jgi:integrase
VKARRSGAVSVHRCLCFSINVLRCHAFSTLATADDFDTADGGTILDFWQAQDRARAAYAANLKAEAARPPTPIASAFTCRIRSPARRSRPLAARDFAPWRTALTKAKLSPAAINRVNSCLRAALNLARDQDERIVSARAWEKALAAIPDATQARNVILAELDVRAIIAAAYEHVGPEFGLLTEVAAVTGARVSQLARLELRDVQSERTDPRLMMPSSRKGRGHKRIDRRPVPIPHGLAARLRAGAKGRLDDAPLLVKPSGEPWRKSDHHRLFARAVRHAGLGEHPDVTIYALRHSSIVRQLLAGTPIRIVAVLHDTSVAMIERTYSRHIGDHSDHMARRALLDLAEPLAGNVRTLVRS